MRIIRIVAREFYFNFNISIDSNLLVSKWARAWREIINSKVNSKPFPRANTSLNNAHTREEIGTSRSRDSITTKYRDTVSRLFKFYESDRYIWFLIPFLRGEGGERSLHVPRYLYRPSGIKLCIKRDHFLSTEIGNWNKRSGWEEEGWLRLISASLSTRIRLFRE